MSMEEPPCPSRVRGFFVFGGLAGVSVGVFSAAQVACGKIPANTPRVWGP